MMKLHNPATHKYHKSGTREISEESKKKSLMAAVGFEPTPPERLVPKTSALDHSAKIKYDLV